MDNDKPKYQATVPLIVSQETDLKPVKEVLGEKLFGLLKECSFEDLHLFDQRLPVVIFPCTHPLIKKVNTQYPSRKVLCATFRIPQKAREVKGQFFRIPDHGTFFREQLSLLIELNRTQRQKKRLIEQVGSIQANSGLQVPSLNLDLSRTLIIREALDQTGWKPSRAANLLGISRQALSQALVRNPIN